MKNKKLINEITRIKNLMRSITEDNYDYDYDPHPGYDPYDSGESGRRHDPLVVKTPDFKVHGSDEGNDVFLYTVWTKNQTIIDALLSIDSIRENHIGRPNKNGELGFDFKLHEIDPLILYNDDEIVKKLIKSVLEIKNNWESGYEGDEYDDEPECNCSDPGCPCSGWKVGGL